MSRLAPLPADRSPELQEAFAVYKKSLGFVPNSVLILQRRPKIVIALAQLAAAVWDEDCSVDRGFKRLLAHVSSRVHGCQYCMAHTAGVALMLGIDAKKLEQVWVYQSSPLFTEAERVAIDFTVAASSVPNAVDDALFERMQAHWSEDEIVEITSVIAIFGFMNRWNDTMATPLEEEAVEVGQKHLAEQGWSVGKHVA